MQSFKHLRRIPKWLVALPLAAAMASPAFAQAEFPMETTPVTLDGTAVGTPTSTTLSDSALLNSIVLVDGTYHMWARRGNGKISQMIHATSDDGIRFTTDAALRPPANYWTTCPSSASNRGKRPFSP